MFDKKEAFCQAANATVRVWCQDGSDRGAFPAASRVLRCERSVQCPKTTFCRFVNPLTTRSPLVFGSGAPPAPRRAASTSTRLAPVPARPAVNQ